MSQGSGRPVLRRCVACRSLTDRQELWRVIRLADGSGLALDRGFGRSAYLCQDPACLEEARRRRRLQKALRCQVADSITAALEQRLATSGQQPLRQDDHWSPRVDGPAAPPEPRPLET